MYVPGEQTQTCACNEDDHEDHEEEGASLENLRRCLCEAEEFEGVGPRKCLTHID